MKIEEDLTFGIDLGIASCGWAVIRGGDGDGGIVALGTWMFDAPETAKERTPTNQLRRQHRGMRRVLKRRRQRMDAVRKLFKAHGLIAGDDKDALKIAQLDPWRLRAAGLDRKLTGPELAVALGHIAKHRGFKSNSKRDRGENAPDEDKKMLTALAGTREKLATYRSVGEMFARDEAFSKRKRNRDGEYTRSVQRDDQKCEVLLLFETQRRAGNALATPMLEEAFVDEAFFQRPLADSETKVGWCLFEPDERRAARRSYSFELFRFLSRLTSLRIGKEERSLTAEEIGRVAAEFARQKTLTFKALRRLVPLADDQRFAGVKSEDEKNDFVARKGAAAEGAAALRQIVAENAGTMAWNALLNAPDKLDRVAFVLSFREDVGRIREGLEAIELEPDTLAALMEGVAAGRFAKFEKAGHISAKAARAMIPHLRRGMVYSEAAKAVGYEHSDNEVFDAKGLTGATALKEALRSRALLEAINNPVARKAATEAMKQVKAMIEVHGVPGRIHIELARAVGKSEMERNDITRGIERRNKQKDRLRAEYKDAIGRECRDFSEDLLRYELWKEQDSWCLYCGEAIPVNAVGSSDNVVQVDHILPWSRSGDDSFVNKTLCHARCNQNKRGRTPFEWLGNIESVWELFRSRVESRKWMKGVKKRNYLLKDAAVLEERFKPRNLNDTKYATRVLLNVLAQVYPKGERGFEAPVGDRRAKEKRRVFARPGALTDRLRRGWGIQDLKKDEEGARRSDDRHHALDALICAARSESALQRLTRSFQACEDKGSHRDFADLDPPWPGFVEEARNKLHEVFVARAERRRARGEAHAATVRGVAERDGVNVVYEKKVEALTLADLERIKDPERNAATIGSLRAWLDAGKPSAALPRSPKGDEIRKVKLRTSKKVDVLVRDGAAERGEMVRVDVFRKQNRRAISEYFLVPIYPHQVADAEDWVSPPNKAGSAYKPEEEWPAMADEHEFLWSVYPLSLIEVETAKGLHVMGYCRGLNRATGALTISPPQTRDDSKIVEGIGARTLKFFAKHQVDRLGRYHQVLRETRTWRGVACT